MLYRVKEGKIIGGLINGIAIKYNKSVVKLRIFFALLCVPIPALILVYFFMCLATDYIDEV